MDAANGPVGSSTGRKPVRVLHLPQEFSGLRIDPDTGKVTPLFHPRRDHWTDQFAIVDGNIIGRTPTGRTTAWLLEMNSSERVRMRQSLARLGLLS
ncbi:MAG TPA: hypothetical protein VFZ59_08035 [Verrucomicrobiae bacterium]|nr:hypothetical protein [Verrucomicrobiae bacterium]